MESDKNSTGEDVTGKITNSHFESGTDVTGDFVDAKPQTASNNDTVKKEESRIYVHQCKDDLYYNTNHSKRGLAVIFNHEKFDLNLETRYGTKADCDNLENTLRNNMNFEVIIHNDLYFKQLDAVLEQLATFDFSDYNCLAIVVLSHGEQNNIYARNMSYSTNVLFDHFTPNKCPTLAGKPKIFIIQACQGSKFDKGHYVQCDKLDSGVTSYRMPTHADFLFAYSTIPGYYSWRNTIRGSWFIQAFCEEFNHHWKDYDFLTILTFVNRRVAYDFESNVPDMLSRHCKKQVSTFTSQLTRILKFSPKTVENSGVPKRLE